MSEAKRYNEGKIPLSFVFDFPRAMAELSRVMEKGAAKYGRGNWQKGGKPDEEYLDSGLRHIRSYRQGEAFDTESQCSHLAHAAWNLLAWLELNAPTSDDPEYPK